ncbi:MAG: xylose isomerase [Spirochaetales bacterium]
MKPFIGNKEYFPGIGSIPYEGPQSKNPLAFKFYNAQKKVGVKTMEEHLRFSVAYWHSLCGDGKDMFGSTTLFHLWDKAATPLEAAEQKLDAAFEFITKIGAPFYCFHDRDLAPEGETPLESEKNLLLLVEKAKERQKATGVKLLWGTANLFSHPRYMNGAATNPDFRVVAQAAAQVKAAIDATLALEGQGYVFWGGREGYTCLLNTDLKREQEHLARFLTAARDYGRKQGFKGTFYIEPKPKEPTKHQYDFDAATVIGFLRKFGLEKDFKINVEANHAELAAHDFAHELAVAASEGMLGSIDANRGDPRLGWDTDQFPTTVYETTLAMLVVLQMGGFTTGGLNFDAKVRRESIDPEDLFLAHIGGMDAFALGLETAHQILQDGVLPELVKKRYSSFDSEMGKKFESGALSLPELAALASNYGDEGKTSGKQEWIENLLNYYLFNKK